MQFLLHRKHSPSPLQRPTDYYNAIAGVVMMLYVGKIGRNPFVKYRTGEMQRHWLLV